MRGWIRVALVAAMLAGAAPACRQPQPTSPDRIPDDNVVTPPSAAAAELIRLTIVERERAGLAGLAPNNRLMYAAELQVAQVAATGQLEHMLPGAQYPTLQDRVNAAGYQWQAVGENLAYGQRTPAHAIAEWMGSSGHRANVLNPSFTEIGVATVVDTSGRPYYVQVFGRPR